MQSEVFKYLHTWPNIGRGGAEPHLNKRLVGLYATANSIGNVWFLSSYGSHCSGEKAFSV